MQVKRAHSHVLAVGRVDGGRVAVAPQHDDGGQHVQRGVKLQSENTHSSWGGQRNSRAFTFTSDLQQIQRRRRCGAWLRRLQRDNSLLFTSSNTRFYFRRKNRIHLKSFPVFSLMMRTEKHTLNQKTKEMQSPSSVIFSFSRGGRQRNAQHGVSHSLSSLFLHPPFILKETAFLHAGELSWNFFKKTRSLQPNWSFLNFKTV